MESLALEGLMGIGSYSREVDAWLKAELAARGKNVNTSVQRSWYFS